MERIKELTVCSFGFNVPCRRFLITANITRDKRLPVVDEFILRVLKLCERVPVRRLGQYLGFSDAETETVIGDLAARSFVMVEGDTATLHPSAHAHFRGTEDGAPRVMEVETWFDRVWFDLISRNMMKPDRFRLVANLINIDQRGTNRDLAVPFARKAFEENFADYLRSIKRIEQPDRLGLYSISEVKAERFGFVVIKGREDLVFDPQPRLNPHLLEMDADRFARFRPLANAMNDAYRRLTAPEPSAAAQDDFKRLTGDLTLAALRGGNGHLDLTGWLSAEARRQRRRLVGVAYLDRNLNAFLELLEREALPRLKSQNKRSLELYWIRPGGSRWGASTELQDAVLKLRSAVRQGLSKELVLRSFLVVPPAARKERNRRFNRIFDHGYYIQSGLLSPALEVVVIRGVAAIVTVQTTLSATTAVPVGWAIADEDGVKRVEEQLHVDALSAAEPIWTRAKGTEEDDKFSATPSAVPSG